MIQYKGWGDVKAFDTMEEFALARVEMEAPLLGGMTDAAVEYNWSIIEDGKERNPTPEEKTALRETVNQLRAANEGDSAETD